MQFRNFLSSSWSSHAHCGQLQILIIFLICELTFMQHVRNVASSKITTTTTPTILAANKTTSSFNDENGFSVELPKPLLMLANRKSTTNSVEAMTLSTLTSKRHQRAYSHRPTLMDVALQVSAREGLHAMTELYGKLVPNIIRNGHLLEDNHPAALLSKFSESNSETLQQEMAAYATISATKAFRKNYKYFNELARQAHTSKISLRHTALEGLCPPRDPPTCMPASARYRTHDGTCNSRRRPRWGASQMPFNRFLPPEYGDGVDSVRMSVDGGPLASSRFVSLLVHGARDGEAPVTLMTAQWGQLLDHDMTSTAQPRSINGSVPSCCGNTNFHPSCFPIKVPLDDPWLAPLKVRCLEFLRSAPAQRRDCILSWREQTNQATSYIDASPIYSNSVKSSDNARVFRNGLLVFGRGKPTEDSCQRGALATHCIRAGDGRSGEQPGLLALHHVWVGEHNRIAMELSQINLHWSDEKIYQEARRIVGAMFQHITYREFLPIVLGREVCKLFDLELLSSGYYEGYDPKTNPTIANSFAAAAFRFGHSLVQNSYMRCDRFHNFLRNNVSLHEEFQRGDIGSPGSLHRLLRGLVNQRALKRDEFITPELTNHLFQTPGFPFGLDLAAINIQRGRDHGVPPYTAWRVPCGLTPINNWEEFANVVGPQSAHRISHAYRSVHDIDLFVGGIAERPVVGGLVGPTFACIIAQQFSNSRKGDRFWYENGGLENSFTPAQLNSIRRVSLAQILCRSVGGGTMQPHAFLPTEVEGNERQMCGAGTLTTLDLSPWIEHDPFTNAPPTTETQEPDRIFNIVTQDDKKEPHKTGTVQVIKDNKVGFPNRVRPSDNKNTLIGGSSGFVQGIQVPGEIIRINDKLDIRQKVKPVKRPTATAKPIKGINNKLDKGPTKLTLNIRGVTVRRPQATRRAPVVVNNIPLELRTANETKKKGLGLIVNGTQVDFKLNRNMPSTTKIATVDKQEARTDDTDAGDHFQLNEPPKTQISTKLLDKHVDVKLEEKLKESNKTNVDLSSTHKLETAKENSGADDAQTGFIDKSNSTKEDDGTLLLQKVEEKSQNLLLRTENRQSSTKEDNTPHLENKPKGQIETKETEKRLKTGSNEYNNMNLRQITKNYKTVTEQVDVGTKKADTNENTKGDTSTTRNTTKTGPELEEKNSEDRKPDKQPENIEINSENLNEELTTERYIETLTKKLEALKADREEEPLTKKETTIIPRTIGYNNNIQDSFIDKDLTQTDKELTIKREKQDTYETKRDQLSMDYDEKVKDNEHKLTMKSNDKDSTDNDENVPIITISKGFPSGEKIMAETNIIAAKLNHKYEDKTGMGTGDLTDTKVTNISTKQNTHEHTGGVENTTKNEANQEHKNDNAQITTTRTDHSHPTRNHESNTERETSTTTLETSQDTEDINPLTQKQTNEAQKRLKRRRTEDTHKFIGLKGAPAKDDTKTRLHTKTTKNTTNTTKIPTTAIPRKTTITRTTSRQVELRQYQTRPQKVVVKGPNSDQYEIEINIRQTNQKQTLSDQHPVSAVTNPYTNYPSTYKPYYGYDRYPTSYVGTYYPSNKVTIATINAQNRRTRPPTIIYVDDPEDRYTIPTTTRGPGLFQNILTYATSGFGNFNKQQQASPHSTTNIQKERPPYGAGDSTHSNGNNQIYTPNSHYIPRPSTQTQALPTYPAVPAAATLSQVGGVVSGGGSHGAVQATSSAISSGNFGTITGVAQANGADSTFSFNIRPKPSQTQLPLPLNEINGGGGSFGLLPTQNNIFSQLPNPSFGNFANSEASSSGNFNYGNTNKPSANSPFSSANKRPQQESYYGYYGQKLPLQQKTELDGIETGQDYDEFAFARTLEPIRAKISSNNETSRDVKNSKDEYSDSVENENEHDYDYTDDSLESSEKFERDGYVRPEDVINTVLKSKENELRNLTNNKNCTVQPLDDNYVLPILSTTNVSFTDGKNLYNTTEQAITEAPSKTSTTTTETVTNFPDIMEKHFNNDILAIDYEDELTESKLSTPERMLTTLEDVSLEKPIEILANETRETAVKIEHTEDETLATKEIAFAPIKILNKLERPDNWLIYDSPENYTRLPELPAMYEEDSSAPANEIPKPFQGFTSLWVNKAHRDKDRNREQQLLGAKKQLPIQNHSELSGSKVLTTTVSGNRTHN